MINSEYNKFAAYCTSCERCVSEVVEKMRRADIDESSQDEIVEKLKSDGFIDERRYAKAFTADKFRFCHWGKRKIAYALRMKGIPDSFIDEAVAGIDEEEYEEVRKTVIEQKTKTLKGDINSMENRSKIFRFLQSRGFVIAILLLISAPCVKAAGLISGTAKEYAGKRLELYYEHNGITHERVLVDSCRVDSAGNFSLSTDITETHQCFIPLGVYKGVIYVEPYKNYHINLPPLTLPSEGDILNPYFIPKELLLSLINPAPDDLNLKITAFDDSFDVAFNRIIKEGISPERIEKEIVGLESTFGGDDRFFTDYRYSDYAILVNMYEPTQPYTAINAFFIDREPAYNNPAYWEAFDVIFEQFKHIEQLSANKQLQELVILHHVLAKNLPGTFAQRVSDERNIEIKNQVIRMLGLRCEGCVTGVTTIKNINGDTLQLKDFETPQIYIIFANAKIDKSLSDLEFAASIKNRWKNDCSALIVFIDAEKEDVMRAAAHIKDKRNIIWAAENSGFTEVFGVDNAPQYFLIDSNGKILISPAEGPESFRPMEVIRDFEFGF